MLLKINFTDAEIEFILDKADSSYRHNKLSTSKKRNFLLTLKTYLNGTGGVINDVCQSCLGSGRNKS